MWRLNGTSNPNIVLFERPVTRGELKKERRLLGELLENSGLTSPRRSG